MAKFDNLTNDEFRKIVESCSQWKELGEKFGYNNTLSSNLKKRILDKCDELGITWKEIVAVPSISSKTKGDLLKDRKNWQSARSGIRKHADQIFENSGTERKCWLCGYDKHIEIAHIKAVADFDDSSLISEINDIHNLIPLCPNHHWEFDHNCLSEENLNKIKKYSAIDQ